MSQEVREDEEDLIVTETPPPSLLPGPLFTSYTWDSDSIDPKLALAANRGEPWMLGVDEAGRGSVCGPQVYGVAFCPKSYEAELLEPGFDDSKKLSATRRRELLEVMCEGSKDLKWAVRVMTPYDISKDMLRKTPINLNEQSHEATMSLIQHVLEKGYNLTECYVDTVGDADKYKIKLAARFPGIAFVVAPKADSLYPIVSAASIAAKVTRDAAWTHWTMAEPGVELPDIVGSGYPSDPRTKALLEAQFDPIFGFPTHARFSWETIKSFLVQRGAKVHWNDEPPSIQRFFQPGAQSNRPQLWKDLALESPSVF